MVGPTLLPFVRATFCTAVLALVTGVASAQSASFVEPKDGATVATKFTVRLAATGLRLAPPGEGAGTAHHHVLVNMDPIPAGEEIPFTRRHIHLNKGQSEIEITLQPGTYKLTAQPGDSDHRSLGPKAAQTITITVK